MYLNYNKGGLRMTDFSTIRSCAKDYVDKTAYIWGIHDGMEKIF